eukprot:jgi/Ulvmu1/5558/UM023_0095.1
MPHTVFEAQHAAWHGRSACQCVRHRPRRSSPRNHCAPQMTGAAANPVPTGLLHSTSAILAMRQTKSYLHTAVALALPRTLLVVHPYPGNRHQAGAVGARSTQHAGARSMPQHDESLYSLQYGQRTARQIIHQPAVTEAGSERGALARWERPHKGSP